MNKLNPKAQHRHFLRNYIADLAIAGAKKKNCGQMCSSCAFKRDSPANLEPHNVAAAADALDIGQFNCHIESGVDSGRPCNGFLNALQVVDPDRKTVTTYPKNLFKCPSCQKTHGDKNDKLWKRCNQNKSGMTKFTCSCNHKFLLTYNFMNRIETF